MRTLLLGSCAISVFAFVLFVLVLLPMGVPYHDGPNAGYINPPGVLRDLENAWFPLFIASVVALLMGGGGLVICGVWWIRRKQKSTRG